LKYFDITDTEIWLDIIPITNLYLPLAKKYGLAEFAFFLIDDDWDEQSLIDLKNTTGPSFLFGLQATSKRTDKLDVIDVIIVCRPDENKQVMKVYEVTSNRRRNLLTTDFNDLKKALQFTKSARFVQATKIQRRYITKIQRPNPIYGLWSVNI